MNRRTFLKRAVAGLGVAAVGGSAIALAKSPDTGQPLATLRASDTPDKAIQAEPWPTTHWWERPVEWLGDPLDHNHPLSWWAQTHQFSLDPPMSQTEYLDAMEFHLGLQWPQDVHELRMRESRPTLVINMIAKIVERAVIVSEQRGESIHLSDPDWRMVFVNAYRRNKDAQLHYNAMQSARLEMKMLDVKKRVVVQSRIHEQDLAGEILRSGEYEHLRLPIESRPCLTFNRLPQLMQQVVDEQRDHELKYACAVGTGYMAPWWKTA